MATDAGYAASHQKRGIIVDMQDSVLQGVVSSCCDSAAGAGQAAGEGYNGAEIWLGEGYNGAEIWLGVRMRRVGGEGRGEGRSKMLGFGAGL